MLLLLLALSTVNAEDPPRIETAPHDQTVVNGAVAYLVCTAVGNPRPQLEWRKNGKRVITHRYTVQEMPGGSVLRIEPVRTGRDNASYECVAENGVGEPVRALATLNVLPENGVPPGFPRIVKHPTMQGVERGRGTLLPCRAEGDPEPTIQWLKDVVPVDMTEGRYSLVPGGSLQILDAQEEDQGSYECVAENVKGTAVSNMASLFVRVRRVPPYFSIPPEQTIEVMPGSNVNVTCVAVGSPMPFVKWRASGSDLTPEHAIPIGKNVLQLESVRESVNYTCVASSKLGSIEAVTQILVQALPRPPTGVTVSDVTATSVRLTWSYDVGAENVLYYVVQYKPKQANQEYSEISGINTMFYTIRDLTPYTEYEFFVLAVNAIGRGNPSAPALITTGETEPGSAPRNVQGRPLSASTIVVQWDPPKEPNGQVTGYKVYYTTRPNLPTAAWSVQAVDNNQLTTISDLTHHTIYTLRVQAFTSRGPGPLSSPVQVKTQQGVPSQPSNLRAVATSSTSVQLSWTRPAHPRETIVGYVIYWNDTFTQQAYQLAIPNLDTYTLQDLDPDTLYYVWVAAKSRRGEGPATAPLPVKTDQYVPSAPPTDVRVTPLGPFVLQVTWQAPPRRTLNGPLAGFGVRYAKSGDPWKIRRVGPEASGVMLRGLEAWTTYRVQVWASTEVGHGPATPPVLAQTDEGGIYSPQHLHNFPQLPLTSLPNLKVVFLTLPSIAVLEPIDNFFVQKFSLLFVLSIVLLSNLL